MKLVKFSIEDIQLFDVIESLLGLCVCVCVCMCARACKQCHIVAADSQTIIYLLSFTVVDNT
jgi:hypothetical protein